MPILDANEIFFTAFEPKVKNRFIMYVDGLPSFTIKAISDIKIDQGEIALPHINILRKVKSGRSVWDNITMTLYDPITPAGSQAVMEWVRLHHESVTGRDGYSDFYKKDLTIDVIGPPGDIVSEWVIKGAFIKDAIFTGWDWESKDDINEITMTIAMDYCILNF